MARKETAWSSGVEGASYPYQPQAPVFEGHGSGSIDVSWTATGNDPAVVYALRVTEKLSGAESYTLKGYVKADGTLGESEVWRALATWGAVTVSGLTDFAAYTFAARSKSELGDLSVWSDESAIMNTLPDIDEGMESDALDREITGGNVVVDDTLGVVVTGSTVAEVTDETRLYGVLTATYTLASYESDTASIEAEYSEDDGANWATATSSGGDGKTGLASSPAGTVHTFGWDSYADAGTSEYQRDMKFRIRALDAEGDAGAWVESETIILYNRPEKPTVTNYDSREWDEDTTPVFLATMPRLRGGGPGFPVIRIYDTTEGTPLVSGYPKKGVEDVRGWEYETAANTWVALTPDGIPGAKCNGTLRMRYTVQVALAVGEYLVTMTMGEVRDLG